MIYNNIKHDIKECKACPLSSQLDYGCYPQWGIGNKAASILVLNLRSNQESHLVEKPIETKYSLLLRKILENSGWKDTDVFVTNLIKCKCDLTPAKTFKANAEICKKTWLYKELEALPNVKYIVCMGKTTHQRLLDNKLSIDDINDNEISVNEVKIYSTYSLEEIFRKGQSYINHATLIFSTIKESNV